MSDFDARVAALMNKFTNYRYLPVGTLKAGEEEFEQAIRAELQKPAMHEPVTDAEVASAIAVSCEPDLTTYGQGMRKALESFLQGRAKPATECQHKVFSHFGDQKLRRCVNCGIQETAQEEITDAEIYKIILKMEQSPSFSYDTRDRDLVRAGIRASKGEKT